MPKVNREVQDPIVAQVVNKIIDRSEVGLVKYGTDLTRGDLTTLEWMQHCQDELLDGANYLEVLKGKINLISQMMYYKSNWDLVNYWCDRFKANRDPTLWMMLVIEEFKETMAAFGLPCEVMVSEARTEMDKVEVLDGLCDLVWVAMGLARAFHWDFDGAFMEVYNSNMSKLGEDGNPIFNQDETVAPIGKIMKGPNFFKPRLKKFVEEGDKARFGDVTGFRK